MRKVIGLGAGLFGTLVATTPVLAVEPGFYIGGAVGQTTVEGDFGGFDFDETDTSWKAYAGARFGLFGIEGGYVNLADSSDENVSMEATGWDLFGTLNIGAGPITVFAKAGGILWDAEAEIAGIDVDDDDTDLAYGAGVAFNITPLTAIRAEWERFEIDELADIEEANIDQVDMMSLGLDVTF
jgi:opacity protein-like surface antigen